MEKTIKVLSVLVLLVFLASLVIAVKEDNNAPAIPAHGIYTNDSWDTNKDIIAGMEKWGEKYIESRNRTKAKTDLNITEETENNKTKLHVNLSNGRKAEIKIMPETASQKAIERLGELGFNITLKEVGKGNETKLAYELETQEQGKFLGLFKVKLKKQVQVDAETGEVIKVKKPWYSFLVA